MALIAQVLPVAALLVVLGFAVLRPRGLPEATAAIPLAVLVVLAGALPVAAAVDEVRELLPTVVFLAAVLVLGHLCESAGVFRYCGSLIGRLSHGRPTRLLLWVFLVSALATAVLSLDATIVLLTPVVFVTASRIGARPKPHVYACTHLANTASLLLPVSNLTNLLAFPATGLSFLTFGAVMALPWVLAIAVELLVFGMFFRTDLALSSPTSPTPDAPLPRLALAVVAATMLGFCVSSLLHVEPLWPALIGAGVLLAVSLVGPDRSSPGTRRELLRSVASAGSPLFLLFVLALGVVVRGVEMHGLGGWVRGLLPSGRSLASLLLVATLAAVLANAVNNLPAILLLLPGLAPHGAAFVLAALIGVNIGPNLTYAGSLATLLWRRILRSHDAQPALGEYLALGALTVPATVVAAVVGLWLALRLVQI